MLAAGLFTGHVTLADWLFLIAAILFAIAGILAWTRRPDPTTGALVPIGLALIAVGWLVL
jgi:hypothetical protein